MTIFQRDLQLAVGHNNAAGFVILQSVTPTGADRPYPPADTFGGYVRGERIERPNGRDFWRGYASTSFLFRVMPWLHDTYLRTTFCSGADNFDGLVTVRLQTNQPGTFANYNAIMKLPQLADLTRRRDVFIDYAISFIELEAI